LFATGTNLSIDADIVRLRGLITTSTVTATNIFIPGVTSATSTTSGALQVIGGVGIGGDLYVGGDIISRRLIIEYTTITTTSVTTDDVFTTTNNTNSTGTNTGALVIAGGAGFGKDVWIGGQLYVKGRDTNLNGTVLSTDGIGNLAVTNTAGVLKQVTLDSIKIGSTSTTSGVTITVDQYNNIRFTSANGTILNGYTGSKGDIGYTGSRGPGANQNLNTTSSVTFANITLGPTGVIIFANGTTQSGRAARMVIDQDFIDAPDYDAFFASLLPGDFYWSVTYSQIKILVDYGGYYDWQDLTVYAA